LAAVDEQPQTSAESASSQAADEKRIERPPMIARAAVSRRRPKAPQKAPKMGLFIDEIAPIFRERSGFEAQYGFDRPAALGGVLAQAWHVRVAIAASA
jgi:hypothetical protein